MNKEEADKKALEVLEWWASEREKIVTEAKKQGIWQKYGLDSNEHLFKKIDAEAKEKFEKIREMVDR